jgi:DNA-binding MarR family transcriptional regulator
LTAGTDHPASEFEDLVHQPNRLAILVILKEAKRADFNYLKKTLGLTDGNLGRHLAALAEADYILLDRGFDGRRPRTWVTLRPRGAKALDRELRAMRRLLDRLDS